MTVIVFRRLHVVTRQALFVVGQVGGYWAADVPECRA